MKYREQTIVHGFHSARLHSTHEQYKNMIMSNKFYNLDLTKKWESTTAVASLFLRTLLIQCFRINSI